VAAQTGPVQIRFNADDLAWALDRLPPGHSAPEFSDRVDGAWLLDRALAGGNRIDDLIDSPRIAAALVLAASPKLAWVFPTEQYYYFEIEAHGRRIAGNLRFTDCARGELHCGVYDRDDIARSGYASLTAADEFTFSRSVVDGIPRYGITDLLTGAVRTFAVPTAAPAAVALIEGEEAIAPIRDESGFGFVLVYDHACCQFRYLFADAPSGEVGRWDAAAGVRTFEPSGFRFWTDPFGREWLAAVTTEAVRLNTFHDGPFDQVPPDLHLRPMLIEAYPGIEQHAGDSLDAHGNWKNRRGVRVAISPYADVAADCSPWKARGRAVWMWSEAARARGMDVDEAIVAVKAPSLPEMNWNAVMERAHRWPVSHLIADSIAAEPLR